MLDTTNTCVRRGSAKPFRSCRNVSQSPPQTLGGRYGGGRVKIVIATRSNDGNLVWCTTGDPEFLFMLVGAGESQNSGGISPKHISYEKWYALLYVSCDETFVRHIPHERVWCE